MDYDPSEWDRMGRVNCSKVFVDVSEHSLGVFAHGTIRKGEIVETGLVMRLKNVDGNENPHLLTWSDDRSVWGMSSGCIPFYNHSSCPNVKKVGDLANDKIIIVALRDIEKREELRDTYYSAKWRTCFVDELSPRRDDGVVN